MSKDKRQELIRLIEEKRNSYVLAYVSNEGTDGVTVAPEVVREMYNLLCELKPIDKKRPLDLFIYAGGGDRYLSWQVVSMIRELFRMFNVIIPYKAHGAATMISLGSDTLTMGERAELSPLEITVTDSYGHGSEEKPPVSVEDVIGFFSMLERLGRLREKQRIDAFMQTTEKISPLLLGSINKTYEQTKSLAMRLMESRRRPFPRRKNRKIIDRLLSEYLGPQHTISRSEATKKIGIKHIKPAGELEDIFWELFTCYESDMKIHVGSSPEDTMASCDEEERVFPDHKLVYLETTKRARVYQFDMKIRKVRQYPPTVEFNPQIALPAVDIPPQLETTEEGVSDFIQQWLQGNLPGIIHDCFERLKKELPVVAFERTQLNKRWLDD